jgi:general secretion pathway protein K
MNLRRNILRYPGPAASSGGSLSRARRRRGGLAARLERLNRRPSARRGAIVLLSIMIVSVSSVLIAQQFIEDVTDQFLAIRSAADGMRAREVAMAGFQAGLTAVKTVPEEYLYSTGLVAEPPDLMLAKDCSEENPENCTYYFVSLRIQPEDGKINLNNLVRFDGEPDDVHRRVVNRLFAELKIPIENTDNLIDWIDENDSSVGGAENNYYAGLRPPREIKNFRLFSLSEICVVKGFTREMVYENRAPDGWAENREEAAFLTEDEKTMIQLDDWVLANNVTAFLPYSETVDTKVNINAARYHTLMSLSDGMTEKAVADLFKLRRRYNGYIKNLSELRELASWQQQSTDKLTLYEELAGTGGDISGMMKSQGDYYRVVGVGSVVRKSDNQDSQILAVRKVWGIWDKSNRQLIYYSED